MWVTTLTIHATEVFVTHVNALLTPEGRRRLAVLIVEDRWSHGALQNDSNAHRQPRSDGPTATEPANN